VHAFVVVARQRRRALGGFVVGVGVHGEQREAFGHPAQAIGAGSPAFVALVARSWRVRGALVVSTTSQHHRIASGG
jgi:hypothetical protein